MVKKQEKAARIIARRFDMLEFIIAGFKCQYRLLCVSRRHDLSNGTLARALVGKFSFITMALALGSLGMTNFRW
jgi:hypothetical protein